MGIPSYFSQLVKKYKGILKPTRDSWLKVHNLYLDSNSIIYDATREIKYTGDNDIFQVKLIELVCQKIKGYIETLEPNFALVAFDGVAPVAKLEQQRNRRYKSWLEQEINHQLEGKISEAWCTASITPGTSFMKQLGKGIIDYFKNYEECDVIVSTSDEAGEGEHKIFAHIRENSSTYKSKTHVIYGLDADLIMLTLNHLHISENMYLFRETPQFIKSIDRNLNPNELYCIDIPELHYSIVQELTNSAVRKKDARRVNDYILLCFLLGNDFMPHFPSLNIRNMGIDHIMEAYRSTLGTLDTAYLSKDNCISWGNLKKIVTYLADKEDQLLEEEYTIRARQCTRAKIPRRDQKRFDRFQLLPIIDRREELYIAPQPHQKTWKHRYYDVLFDCKYDSSRVKQICIRYLEALQWTFIYYRKGCLDWRWCYPYHYAPLLTDLVKYIPDLPFDMISKSELPPVSPLTQLCYVLPRPFHNLLPNGVDSLLSKHFDMAYRTDWEMQWCFCKYFWESHAKMTKIDVNELEKLIHKFLKANKAN